MSQYLPKPFRNFGGNSNIKVDLSSYATKTDFKNVMHVDTSSFAVDIDKLVPVSVDLSKLSDVVRNDIVKKAMYDKLVAKVNNADTSGFVLKTKYETDKPGWENKVPDTSRPVKKTNYNAKIIEMED